VYSLALHPTLPLLITGGRDSSVRVWDIRTRLQVHCMSGHASTVASLLTNATDPQVISGSHDKQIRLWDIRKATTLHTLTYHKKSVRALAMSGTEVRSRPHTPSTSRVLRAGHDLPRHAQCQTPVSRSKAHSPNAPIRPTVQYAFLGGGGGTIKKYKLPEGEFCHNMIQTQPGIINSMAVSPEGVVVSGADDGSLWCAVLVCLSACLALALVDAGKLIAGLLCPQAVVPSGFCPS
jgi:pleiotropic regulator 1